MEATQVKSIMDIPANGIQYHRHTKRQMQSNVKMWEQYGYKKCLYFEDKNYPTNNRLTYCITN